jgi:parvulin-like peptidyl-prolyl isomerase
MTAGVTIERSYGKKGPYHILITKTGHFKMTRITNRIERIITVCLFGLFLGGCGEPTQQIQAAVQGEVAEQRSAAPASTGANDEPGRNDGDVIARVGDQEITFSLIEVTLNSMPVQGLSIPPVGSPDRQAVRFVMLDKLIDSYLLYLDALRQGKDKDPAYVREIEEFSDGVLSEIYRHRFLVGEVPVTEQEVKDFFDNYVEPGTEFTEQVKFGIEARIRRERFKQRVAASRKVLREGIKVSINMNEMDQSEDQIRDDADVVATIAYPGENRDVVWGEVSSRLTKPQSNLTPARRIEALDKYLDYLIMVRKAREAGLEQDPAYLARLAEYRKTRLVVRHKKDLYEQWMPDEFGLESYYMDNRDRFASKEMRRVQMVVLNTEQEAAEVKDKVAAGEITLFEAARDYSIMPGAKQDLGRIGWVARGSGFPELDKLTFSLEVGELGGPVESPAGWHVVRVLEQQDAQHTDITNADTADLVRRRYLRDQHDNYVIGLRKDVFTVEIYEDVLNRLLAEEAKRQEEGTVVQPDKPGLRIEKVPEN